MKLAKTYEPKQYEPNIYALWEASGAFEPGGVGEPYGIIMPPPNANGNLHIGHGLDMNLKDILARFHRMKGRNVAYLPGSDHAGFETWTVYEKELLKQGKSRFDFSREELYDQVWQFVTKQRGNMELQLRALGTSAAWQRSTFTLDRKVVDTVYQTFKKMWNDKLIYRGERIVNYCTQHQTSFADIEVEHKKEATKLWSIAYQLTDDSGEIIAATTRPETKLSQSALVVNPNDQRYKQFVGKQVYQPLVPNSPIPVIADDHVDPEFGTGAVTVTPAHDPNDFEIAKRHNLPIYELIDRQGKITSNAPSQFVGYTVTEARKRMVAALEAADALRDEKDYEHTINVCYKCGTTIEPMVMDQWFVKVKPLAEKAIEAIEAGEIDFFPKNKAKVLVDYLKKLHDWNISRQIAWGIPIPAFQNVSDLEDWIFDERVDQATIEVNGKTYRREEDVFDTWFSSGQWPFVVTDYLQKGDLAKFYPAAIMENGSDLLDRWDARMIMLGLYITGKVPFKQVYVHGMVLDENAQKMSKSKGNVINPMEVVEKFGSDAFRLGIVTSRSAGQNQAFSGSKVIAGRNFANKLWNIARFIEGTMGSVDPNSFAPQANSPADHWIIDELNQAITSVEKNLTHYRFAEATEVVYHTVWGSVADWYLEANKTEPNLTLLGWVLETCLKLAHPFAPFVTETIWQTLGWRQDTLLIKSDWPFQADFDEIASQQFRQLQSLVSEIRYISQQLGGRKQKLLFENDSLIEENSQLICQLAGLSDVQKTDAPQGLRLAVSGREAYIDIDKHTLHKHRKNLQTRLEKTQSDIANYTGRLNNKNYTQNAPKTVVEETREQLKAAQELEVRLKKELELI